MRTLTNVFKTLSAELDNRIPSKLFSRVEEWRGAKACVGSSCGNLIAERATKRGEKR